MKEPVTDETVNLEILICTIGEAGIQRTAASLHPRIEGVQYLISWQTPGNESMIQVPDNLKREDIWIVTHKSRGLCRNRNFAIANSHAPVVLIGDDDVDYSYEGILEFLECLKKNPETDIFLLRYLNNESFVKPYPEYPTPYREAPRGYYATSFEIAFRRRVIEELGIRFNEKLGLGNPVLKCGEEDVFLYDAMKKGASAMIYPITIGSHDQPTTGERDATEDYFIMTHAAVMKHIMPWTWCPRLLVHAIRHQNQGKGKATSYLRLCLAGIRYARREQVF